jgi:hypothetical protein
MLLEGIAARRDPDLANWVTLDVTLSGAIGRLCAFWIV